MARSRKYLQVGLGVGELDTELKDARNPEGWVLFSGEYGPEELHDVIDCVVRVTPGVHEDSYEAGNISRGRLSNVIEAEAGFCTHKAIGGHSHFGGGASALDNKVVSNKVELMMFSVILP